MKYDRKIARLLLITGTGSADIKLDSEEIILGRGDTCDVVIDHPRVSRRHARVSWDGARYCIEDLGSTNGTFVNDQLIKELYCLRPNDEVQIADNRYRFVDPEATIPAGEFPPLRVYEDAGTAYLNQRPLELSAKEYALVAFMYRNRGKVCPKDEIARAVWPEYEGAVYDYQIESLVRRVRSKIEPDPSSPVILTTVRGRGYILNVK